MVKYAISACLLGISCRWNAKGKLNKKVLKLYLKNGALVVCPEIMAGFATPRPACEIVGGDGCDVLAGKAKVVDKRGRNYSKQFIKGAQRAVDFLKKNGVKRVILKSGSPSCGAKYIYCGDFSGRRKKGQGVFAALLREQGIQVEEAD